MLISSKLIIEIIILVSLLSTISFLHINNSTSIEKQVFHLNESTLVKFEALKNMEIALLEVLASTNDIIAIKETSLNSPIPISLKQIEDAISEEILEIEAAKEMFEQNFVTYDSLIDNTKEFEFKDQIREDWESLLSISQQFLEMDVLDLENTSVFLLRNVLEEQENKILFTIVSAIAHEKSIVDDETILLEDTTRNTTFIIIGSFLAFIIGSIILRSFIIRTIAYPLKNLVKLTDSIPISGTKSNSKNEDEIQRLERGFTQIIDELKLQQEEKIKSEKLSSIGNLSSRLAHDLRNPLGVIRNSSKILRVKLHNILDKKTEEQLNMMDRAIGRMTHQIDDIMDFVNIADLKLEKCSILDVLESAIFLVQKPPKVNLSIDKNDVHAKCDPNKLEVALANVILNAFQAVENGGDVSVRIKDFDNEVRIEIEDSGPGIPEENISKIFEPLYTTNLKGTGLGLASAKAIVEKHGGKIEAHNNPTTFTIVLPK